MNAETKSRFFRKPTPAGQGAVRAGHRFAALPPAAWKSGRSPGGRVSGDTHSWLNMRFISSVMFMEPTSSSENRFTSPSCSEMSSSEATLRSFFLGTTWPGREEMEVSGTLCQEGGWAGKGVGTPWDGWSVAGAATAGKDVELL